MKCIWYWEWKIEGEEYQKVSAIFQKTLDEHPEELSSMSPGIH
jgi:hypothetical protein